MPESAPDHADASGQAREIVGSVPYVTIASAGADGTPWASPVWFAHVAYREFAWVSRPDTRHSLNLAERPEVSLVVFDSRVALGNGRAVYLEAAAGEVNDTGEIERLMAAFSQQSVAQGGVEWDAADVTGRAELRLYRAKVRRAWLGVNDRRTEIALA